MFAAVLAVSAADKLPTLPTYSAPTPRAYSAPAQPQYGQEVPQILSQEFDLRDDQSYVSR